MGQTATDPYRLSSSNPHVDHEDRKERPRHQASAGQQEQVGAFATISWPEPEPGPQHGHGHEHQHEHQHEHKLLDHYRNVTIYIVLGQMFAR